MTGCSVEGCAQKHEARGLCNKHYLRLKRTGRLDLLSPDERFWSKVDKTGDCWEWTGAKNPDGYGHFKLEDRFEYAHRYSYKMLRGPFRQDLQIDHKCRNPGCVRPDHLAPVDGSTNQENRAGAQSNSATGIRGVSWDKKSSKWKAQANKNGVRHVAGYFTRLADAERAAIELRNQLFTNNLTDRKAA